MSTWRAKNLKARYGMTVEQFERMWNEQDGRCAVCNDDLTHDNRATHVDHCHATNVVRGLLCKRCNLALGYVREDISIVHRMLDYLHAHA